MFKIAIFMVFWRYMGDKRQKKKNKKKIKKNVCFDDNTQKNGTTRLEKYHVVTLMGNGFL